MLSESEAGKKLCHVTLARGTAGTNCCASDCMAWRWVELKADEAFGEAVIKAAAEINDTSTSRHKAAKHVMQNRAQYGLPTKPWLGYCGLAGKVE